MLRKETTTFDIKSLRTVKGKSKNFDELAKDCVAFANARGGNIHIGIEDGCSLPPESQTIEEDLPGAVQLRISQLTINTSVVANKVIAENGGEYIDLLIHPSVSTIAGTTDGRYFIRISDESCPLHPDQLLRLLNDKPSYSWETKVTKANRYDFDISKYQNFLNDIRGSKRVSQFVKDKTDDELLDYYMFTEGDYLTNLGVLWIGKRNDRAKIKYAPAIQFIKYDESESKVNKLVWDDYTLNPKELIEAIWTQIPDWKEGIEVADGIFRDFIPNYSERTIRELITNAIVHRPYTTAGDIFINMYPDRVEIHNPGNFPIGVTPQNIINSSIRRNEHLCKVAYDLMLMEKEGSGWDVIFEDQLSNGKKVPVPREEYDRVIVTVSRLITNPNIVRLIRKVSAEYSLSSKERIAFGLIAQSQALSAQTLTKTLDLRGDHPTRPWLDRMLNQKIILSKGKTRGTIYIVNPKLLRDYNFQRKPDLSVIESHRLRELIYEDLTTYPESSINEIRSRIGNEISKYKISTQLKILMSTDRVEKIGASSSTRYLVKKSGE